MMYKEYEERSKPKPKPKRKEMNVQQRKLERPEDIEIAATSLFIDNPVHVEIIQPSKLRRLASFRLLVDYVTLAWGIKRKKDYRIRQLEEEIERLEKIDRPYLKTEETTEKEEEDESVVCGLLIQGGEIKGTENEVTDEEGVEGVVPDIAEVLVSFDADYLDAVVGKDERGEPYLYVKDVYSELEFCIQRINSRKSRR